MVSRIRTNDVIAINKKRTHRLNYRDAKVPERVSERPLLSLFRIEADNGVAVHGVLDQFPGGNGGGRRGRGTEIEIDKDNVRV